MSVRAFSLCLVAAVILSTGFALSVVYTFAWVSHPPASITTDLLRAFYMPQALSAGLTLDTWAPDGDASPVAFVLAFLSTLPVSFIYVLIGVALLRLSARARGRGR